MACGLCAEMRSDLFVESDGIEAAPEVLDSGEPTSDCAGPGVVIVGQETVQDGILVSIAGTFPLADSASGNLQGDFLI